MFNNDFEESEYLEIIKVDFQNFFQFPGNRIFINRLLKVTNRIREILLKRATEININSSIKVSFQYVIDEIFNEVDASNLIQNCYNIQVAIDSINELIKRQNDSFLGGINQYAHDRSKILEYLLLYIEKNLLRKLYL